MSAGLSSLDAHLSGLAAALLPYRRAAERLDGSHPMLAGARPRRLLAFANADAGHLDGPDRRAEKHEIDRRGTPVATRR
ncbi:hypothetical protein [Micromonospora sp. DT47]|uniref:hypothetical protein n=1 Tax=Micromonospora sp. DT47 TaxID=3393431 RepID=UPI003CF767A0